MQTPFDPWIKRTRKGFGILWCAVFSLFLFSCKQKGQEEFVQITNTGKNYYDRGEAEKSVAALEKALALSPAHPDAHLNLANAYLLASQPAKALGHAQEVLKQDHNSAAALHLAGCASMRLGQFEEALKYLQAAKD